MLIDTQLTPEARALEARYLKESLKAGDQIIALEDAFYDNGKHSQRRGDVAMVNNPRMNGIVGCHGLTGEAYNGSPLKGLGTALNDGTYRRATPDDPGYHGTIEEFELYLSGQLKWERRQSFWFGVVALMALGALALTHLHAIGL
uniref:Uncharacterized protein n=1 Tax=Pseudomonas phage Cygsa01 TaxID=3138529 RepID=A0AAU6W3C6_9VIRU